MESNVLREYIKQDFKDVSKNHWAHAAIQELSDNGIINGYPNSIFKPDNYITRAEAVKMIALICGDYDPNISYECTFLDCKKDAWYTNYVGFCQRKGLINGYNDGYFKPNEFLTRAEVTVILSRLLEC